MAFAFLSYVREDEAQVTQLKEDLNKLEINTWTDRDSIAPGQFWNTALKKAIENGSFFIACFSDTSIRKAGSYMDEELRVALNMLSTVNESTNW